MLRPHHPCEARPPGVGGEESPHPSPSSIHSGATGKKKERESSYLPLFLMAKMDLQAPWPGKEGVGGWGFRGTTETG